jgi:predicted Na+-dependent transporter
MNVARSAIFVLQLSIFLTVCSLGLRATLADAIWLFRRPSLLLRSLLAMNFFMPLLAMVLALKFKLYPAVKIALVFLAVSPVPPMLPRVQSKLGGSYQYICGLLASTAVLSIILVPLTIELLGKIFGRDVHIGLGTVAKIMLMSVLLPFAVGILIRHAAPGLAKKASAPLSGVAMLLLLGSAAVLFMVALPSVVRLLGNGTALVIAIFVVVGTIIGHWLGGPEPANRSSLALATASRHPGLALALASASFPAQKQVVAAAVLLYLIVKVVALIPYRLWQRGRLGLSNGQKSVEPKQHAA